MSTVVLSDERITELSSLTCSRRLPIAWGINDDPTTPDVFGLNPFTGKTVAEIELVGAHLVDTEALDVSANAKITLGAIGDNTGSRKWISIFVFDEPKTLGKHKVKATEYRLIYPSGKRWNSEALVVHPITGRKFILTKQDGICRIYMVPKVISKYATRKLIYVDALPLSLVTDASFTPDGELLVLRQKGVTSSIAVVDWLTLDVLQPFKVTKVKQPEAVAVEPDGLHVLYGSEGKRSPLGRTAVPSAYR